MLCLMLAGAGLWLFIEGAIYAVAPDFMRRMALRLAAMSSREVAFAGLASAVIGAVLVVFAVRGA
ncbi:DUF2065 domain-containing protein [Hyphomonas johnsonii]|jgi:uncharacterized protein YjeT (DUF2065 family)|uniref:DUF2065 domain-containing protein n=1 Tax=Hyphomonas johnsonii MHS-2 TaxID=1280950 RepID=A0A059FQ72_9PROT|nr:DUF2065 domain-containing protein [Hyphomonas johnsonii]KCZ92809.1 hypothetical protein HJO_07637 [Hyphomonas johnsonii MHS-2]